MREGTRAVHAGLPRAQQGGALLPGPTFAAPFHLSGDPASSPYTYGRYGGPTSTAYETALGELEGAPAVVFASGMAASAAVLMPTLAPGDRLVMVADGYPEVRSLATDHLASRGVHVRLLPAAGGELERACLEEGALEGASLLWLETPTNPGLDALDLESLARAAHDRGALVAVDNTVATPLGQSPLALGADFSVASDTKALTGHSDLIMGHVATAEGPALDALRAWRTQTGAVPGPFETWLAHRSLATLELRLERQGENALRLAEALERRSDVRGVRYPGLPGDPAHPLASRQMRRFGPLIGFSLEDGACAERFLSSLELVADATSFGGVHSTAERRARWGADDVPEGFVRLSAGCEDPSDLLADLDRALEASATGARAGSGSGGPPPPTTRE